MRWANLLHLFRIRLRARAAQDLLALVGIAVGVALLFASQVASSSLTGAVEQLTRSVVGEARLQVVARGADGFPARILRDVQRTPGVVGATPGLQVHAFAIGPRGRQPVDLLGVDPRLARLGGLATGDTAGALARRRALALPASVGQAIGASFGQTVTLAIDGRSVRTVVGLQLGAEEIGALAHSPVVVAALAYAQELAGMEGRVSRIFVETAPGREREVAAALRRTVGRGIDVRAADYEVGVFREASGPASQSTELFAAISALVGFLFAFNAMLLTAPGRRRLVADLLLDGWRRRTVVGVLAFDALVLGVAACAAGLLLGELLSRQLFSTDPGYLTYAFLVGTQRIVTVQSVAVACGGGLVAAGLGTLGPLRTAFAVGARSDAAAPASRPALLLPAGVACLVATALVAALAPQAAIVGMVTLTAALLLLLPAVVHAGLGGLDRLRHRVTSAVPVLALLELRSGAARTRTLAIAATGAVAVFGSVAIQGAHSDLQRGLDDASSEIAGRDGGAHVWVSPPGEGNTLATVGFLDRGWAARLAGLPDVRAVELFRGGFLDVGSRRVWVVGQPRTAARPIPPAQLVEGDLRTATDRLRTGSGWAVLSEAVADRAGLGVGDAFTLPSPRPTRLRVAALTTNLGWASGAIIVNATDYARAWGSPRLTGYDVSFVAGVSAARARREVVRALGPGAGFAVETAAEREARHRAASREGLSRLSEIATLVLIAAVLAMAAAMGGMLWQRRPLLAGLKVDGFGDGELWRALVVESLVLLGFGCAVGAAFGLCGQLLLSRALHAVTGFPVVYAPAWGFAVACVTAVTAVAVVVVAVPGYAAARVRPAFGWRE